MPWGILAFDFAVTWSSPPAWGATADPKRRSLSIYVFFFVVGVLSILRSLPFALALGVSRRSYYAGTALLAVSLAAVYGLALAVLQVIEQATGGWGVGLHFFRVAYILPGPWYLTWLTSFVLLALMFVCGMWFGLIYRRWNLLGLCGFLAALVTVGVAGVVPSPHAHAWPAIGQLLHHPQRGRADRLARRPRGGAAGRRLRHHAPRHRLTALMRRGMAEAVPGTVTAGARSCRLGGGGRRSLPGRGLAGRVWRGCCGRGS